MKSGGGGGGGGEDLEKEKMNKVMEEVLTKKKIER